MISFGLWPGFSINLPRKCSPLQKLKKTYFSHFPRKCRFLQKQGFWALCKKNAKIKKMAHFYCVFVWAQHLMELCMPHCLWRLVPTSIRADMLGKHVVFMWWLERDNIRNDGKIFQKTISTSTSIFDSPYNFYSCCLKQLGIRVLNHGRVTVLHSLLQQYIVWIWIFFLPQKGMPWMVTHWKMVFLFHVGPEMMRWIRDAWQLDGASGPSRTRRTWRHRIVMWTTRAMQHHLRLMCPVLRPKIFFKSF